MAKKKSAKGKPVSEMPKKKADPKKPKRTGKKTGGAPTHPIKESRKRPPLEEAELAALRSSLAGQMEQLADSDLDMRFHMLITTVRADATEEAKRIFEVGGIDLNARYDLDDPSFLQRAAERGNLELVQYFVERGAEVNDEGAYGTALSCAAGKGHMHVYEFLEPLTDPKHREVAARRLCDSQRPKFDAESVNALLAASMQGDLPSVRRLIEAGVDPDASNRRSHGAGPLASASHNGHKEVVDVLLKAGADPNKRDYAGKTPLMGVANADVCRVLLGAGADVHEADNLGRTVLMWVRDAECCRLLLQAGADARAVTQDGLSVLYYVLWWRTQYRAKPTDAYDSNLGEIVRLLVEAGADVNHRPSSTEISEGTPLMHVASLGLCKTAQVLLDAGADVLATGWKGWTALEYAKGHPKMQELLTRAGSAARP